jgi:hypothetical protein
MALPGRFVVRVRSVLAAAAFAPVLGACGDGGAGPDAATGSLEVAVVVDGWALPNVGVLAHGAGESSSAVSGPDGVARFSALPVGSYMLELGGVDTDASVDEPGVAVVEADHRTSVQIPGMFDPGRFTQVRVGGSFTCAMNENRNAYCWGFGGNGELGNGSFGASGRPVRVRSTTPLRGLAVGLSHACGLAPDGTPYCWGSNANGRLGRGLAADELARSALPGPVAGGIRFTTIDAGNSATCGPETGSGRIHCWGSSSAGVLGSPGSSASEPRAVSSLEDFTEVSANDAWAGAQAVAARTGAGRVFFWGAVRQDGNPSWMSFAGPEPTEIPLPGPAVRATPACAELADGRVMCWPDLERDVPPEVLERLVPTSEPGLHEYLVDDLDPAFFRAGLPCTREAAGYVCLQDWFRELPAMDFGEESVTAVSSRGYEGCAVTDAGRVWCWNLIDFTPRPRAGPGLSAP